MGFIFAPNCRINPDQPMKTIPHTLKPLRSRISITYIVLGVLAPLAILAVSCFLTFLLLREGVGERYLAWLLPLFFLFPLMLLVAALAGYPAVAVEEETVTLRSLFKQRQFLRSDIVGAAERYRYRQGKRLVLELRSGARVTIHGIYYRNYTALREALVEGLEPTPSLAIALKKEEKKRLLIGAGLIFGGGLVAFLFLQYQLRKPPLQARGLQAVQLVLAEKPQVELKVIEGDTQATRVALITREHPDVEFQLKGSALHAARVKGLAGHLHPGDHIRLLADKQDFDHAITRKGQVLVPLRAVDVYAARSKGKDLLTLRDYNTERTAQLEYLTRMAGLSLSVLGLFLILVGGRYLMEL